MENEKILFYCPQMEDLARRTAQISGVKLGSVSWGTFKDGYPNLKIENVQELNRHEVYFLADFTSPADIFVQKSVMCALASYPINSFRIVLPYFPTGTMEKVDAPGQVATAKVLARDLSSIPTSRGANRIGIFDIHAKDIQFYFADNLKCDVLSAMPILDSWLYSTDKTDTMIAFPDEGAEKRFGGQFNRYGKIICGKKRGEGDSRIVRIIHGDPTGRTVFIIDDLVMSGGTLIECKNSLMAAGASQVNIFATHGVCPEESWKKLAMAGFGTIWFTDSCPRTAKAVMGNPFFFIKSLANMISDYILL
jgi:ribose-phosphate pyrophosphokinase